MAEQPGVSGGKSWALLLEPLYHIHNPNFSCVIFRQSYSQVKNPGGLLDTSRQIYPALGATLNITNLEWKFKSGARVRFSYLMHEKDAYAFQGSQIPLIGWDELCHFKFKDWLYLLSRNRSTCGVKPYIRATCNPDADSWVADFISWWIGEDGYAIEERSGVIRWFVRLNDTTYWGDSSEELEERFPESLPKSFTFISSKLTDNKVLMDADPGYKANLLALDKVEEERLLSGNWSIRYDSGLVFNRNWVEIIDDLPDLNRVRQMYAVRAWDMASTAAEMNRNACYTACTLIFMIMPFDSTEFTYYIVDAGWQQLGPADGDDWIIDSAYQDVKLYGNYVACRWELEGGSSGPRVAESLRSRMTGINAEGIRPQGDKLTRAKPFAAASKPVFEPDTGALLRPSRVKVLNRPFTDPFLAYLHGFDGTKKEGLDVMDATTLAFNYLSQFDQVNALGWLSSV